MGGDTPRRVGGGGQRRLDGLNDCSKAATFDSLFANRCRPCTAAAAERAARDEIRDLMWAIGAAEPFVVVEFIF
jgi:hypothetical protein